MAEWVKQRVFVTVRTYPSPSRRSIEVSCTAGITEDGRWVRIFPLNYRALRPEQQFHKYQWIDASLSKAPHDQRAESYIVDSESLSVGSGVILSWEDRYRVLGPMQVHCLCCLKQERDSKGSPTLGLFKPKEISRFVITSDTSTWSKEELAKLKQDQPSLFENKPQTQLEKIPYSFAYHFRCDESACSGHELTCTDWELLETYRRWRRNYGANWENHFRQKFETEMMQRYDTYFYVGTLHYYPDNWIIVGLMYPLPGSFRASPQEQLF